MKLSSLKTFLGICCISLSTTASIKVEIFKPSFTDNPSTAIQFPNKNTGQRLLELPNPLYSDHEMLLITATLLNDQVLKIASFNLGELFRLPQVYGNYNNGFRISGETIGAYYERLAAIADRYFKPVVDAGARVLCLQGVPSEMAVRARENFIALLKNALAKAPFFDFDIFYQGQNLIVADRTLGAQRLTFPDVQWEDAMLFEHSKLPRIMAIHLSESNTIIVNQWASWISKHNETQEDPGPVVANFKKVLTKIAKDYPVATKIIVGDFNRDDHNLTFNGRPIFDGDTNDIQSFADLILPNIHVFRAAGYTRLKHFDDHPCILTSSSYALLLPTMSNL